MRPKEVVVDDEGRADGDWGTNLMASGAVVTPSLQDVFDAGKLGETTTPSARGGGAAANGNTPSEGAFFDVSSAAAITSAAMGQQQQTGQEQREERQQRTQADGPRPWQVQRKAADHVDGEPPLGEDDLAFRCPVCSERTAPHPVWMARYL
ncbi:hypothetical protein CYMTET_39894 [Cymbomonas tetramitiformis]|uniref:Uncharacterized protein n=1 Tax=Cymbomonas tetramitiformis TaxID=36881 RepID=A0AAE0F427_9CHLO|nr:hypothetical protein CYMTET_39894 [Cymbomonas tetramitiformis]